MFFESKYFSKYLGLEGLNFGQNKAKNAKKFQRLKMGGHISGALIVNW